MSHSQNQQTITTLSLARLQQMSYGAEPPCADEGQEELEALLGLQQLAQAEGARLNREEVPTEARATKRARHAAMSLQWAPRLGTLKENRSFVKVGGQLTSCPSAHASTVHLL